MLFEYLTDPILFIKIANSILYLYDLGFSAMIFVLLAKVLSKWVSECQ